MTNFLVGSYYEEEAVSKERTRRQNVLKLHVKYDHSGNSGSFLTGEFNDNDDGADVDFDVLDEVAEDPAKSNMATLFDSNYSRLYQRCHQMVERERRQICTLARDIGMVMKRQAGTNLLLRAQTSLY